MFSLTKKWFSLTLSLLFLTQAIGMQAGWRNYFFADNSKKSVPTNSNNMACSLSYENYIDLAIAGAGILIVGYFGYTAYKSLTSKILANLTVTVHGKNTEATDILKGTYRDKEIKKRLQELLLLNVQDKVVSGTIIYSANNKQQRKLDIQKKTHANIINIIFEFLTNNPSVNDNMEIAIHITD